MTPAKINPCLEGLTVDCFKHDPRWAKQAFAYRLLHTITPKKLTRRLPKGLRIALIAPGVAIPPGVDLPPGVTVPPGAVIPTTWTPAQPTPPGTQPPPVTPTGGTPLPPIHTSPGPAGGTPGGSTQEPTGVSYFFQEPFDAFPGTFWTENNFGDGDCELDPGRLKMTVSAGAAQCHGTEAASWPTDYDLYFTINYAVCGDAARFDFYTGIHRVSFLWSCPLDKLFFKTPGGDTEIDAYDVAGLTLTYKMELRSGSADIYRDTTLIESAITPEANSSTPGKINLMMQNSGTLYVDDINIIDQD